MNNSRVAIYFEAAIGGARMVQTTKVDTVVARLGRASRKQAGVKIIVALVVDRVQAKKLRRVLNRHWQSQHRGGGIFTVLPEEIEQVTTYLAATYGLVLHGISGEVSNAAKLAVHRLFAGGKKVKRVLRDGEIDQHVLEELLAAGIITRHLKRSTGEMLYRGTERARSIARKVSVASVPARGHLPTAETKPKVTAMVVVPDPLMSRELMIGRMEEAAQAGEDPHEVVNREAYRVSAVNLREMIGGLAAVTEIEEPQRRGAAHFRRVAEHGQLGGAKAIDYSADRVDTSLVNAVVEIGANARGEYEGARAALKRKRPSEKTEAPGLSRLAVAERMIVQGQSVSEVSAAFGLGKGGAARAKITDIARDAATVLAKHFGYLPSRRSSVRFGGQQPRATPGTFRTEIDR